MDNSKSQARQTSFTTQTDVDHVKRQHDISVFILFITLSLFCITLSLFASLALRTFIYLELFVSFICAVTWFYNQKNINDFRLHFENDLLYIKDRKTGDTYEVYDIPASDFIITQTKKEKKLDYCSLAIKHTVFICGGVKNCSALKEYISLHYL